jgi:hypothetical protein
VITWMRRVGHVARMVESSVYRVCLWGEWWRVVLYTGFWWGDLRERDCFEEGRMLLKWFLNKSLGSALTRLIELRIGTCGGLLWRR